MKKPRRKLTAATALALVGVLGGASTAGAAEAHSPADTDCRGVICMWTGYNYGGTFEVFDPLTSVYDNLSPELLHNVGSFISGTDGCFIRWTGGKQTRPVHNGDFQPYYGRSFGKLMEAVGTSC